MTDTSLVSSLRTRAGQRDPNGRSHTGPNANTGSGHGLNSRAPMPQELVQREQLGEADRSVVEQGASVQTVQ